MPTVTTPENQNAFTPGPHASASVSAVAVLSSIAMLAANPTLNLL